LVGNKSDSSWITFIAYQKNDNKKCDPD